MKTIDLRKSVHEICTAYPEVKAIMAELGFAEITDPLVLNTMGRVMTIPKGAALKKVPLDRIVAAFQVKGFELLGREVDPAPADGQKTDSRAELLKSYVKRLSDGEDLESVRKDFVSHFKEVDASEIMHAEQELLRDGVPLDEMQRLCDVHSALFHGSTREERNIRAGEAPVLPMFQAAPAPTPATSQTAELARESGHPVNVFMRENEAIGKHISMFYEQLNAGAAFETLQASFAVLRALGSHYAKKGDLIYPLLKSRYGISGPSEVMWTVDDEIRAEMRALDKGGLPESEWRERAGKVIGRAEEMIFKENNILLPLCVQHFTEDEWRQMARDLQDYEPCLTPAIPLWQRAEDAPIWKDSPALRNAAAAEAGEIVLPSGHLTVEQLGAMLNTLPLEITFVDANDINRYFNEGEKFFKRPLAALDREVYLCHPPKIEAMVRRLIADFKSGARDTMDVWMEKQGHSFLVRYMAVRDRKGRFIGTMECVQQMDAIKKHFVKG